MYNFKDKKRNIEVMNNYLLNKTVAMFDYINLPKELDRDLIEKTLQSHGQAILFKHTDDKFYFLPCNVVDTDAYEQPYTVNVTNRFLDIYAKNFKVNSDCVLFKSDTLSLGLFPLFEKANYMLAENDISTVIAMFNKRAQILLSAQDDNTVQSAKTYLNRLIEGELGVIAEPRLYESLKVNGQVQHDTNLHDLVEIHQYIKGSLYNELGLRSNYNMKKERVTATEIENECSVTFPLVDNMKHERELACERANTLFNLNISVEFSSSWDYRYNNGEELKKEDLDNLMNDSKESTIEKEDTENASEGKTE